MLQALNVRANGNREMLFGVYGDAAVRAAAHDRGVPGRLPKRHWFGVSQTDAKAIATDIAARIAERLK